MKIVVLLPGKIKPKALAVAQDEYVRRLKHAGIEVQEYRDEKISASNPEKTRKAEADRLLKWLKPDDWVAVCDERGKNLETSKLAEFVRSARIGDAPFCGRRRMVLVIGGALGFDPSVRERADAIWKLSGLVMAGGVARIVLLEGLYRALSLVNGHPYHNE